MKPEYAAGRELVRKHRAPKGALRRDVIWAVSVLSLRCQKAPSTTRCIETWAYHRRPVHPLGDQRAPSTIRCIKTKPSFSPGKPCRPQSESTGRHKVHYDDFMMWHEIFFPAIRKRRAPKGVLRPEENAGVRENDVVGQKAPSAIRCIMTREPCHRLQPTWQRDRKHRAP